MGDRKVIIIEVISGFIIFGLTEFDWRGNGLYKNKFTINRTI